jgi:hypothetical protein
MSPAASRPMSCPVPARGTATARGAQRSSDPLWDLGPGASNLSVVFPHPWVLGPVVSSQWVVVPALSHP